MEVIVSKDYPSFNGDSIRFTFRPDHLPGNIDKQIKAPFQDMSICEVNADDLLDTLPSSTFVGGPPKTHKTYQIRIPGSFYEFESESMDTIAVITCEQDKIVMRSDLVLPEALSRLTEVYDVVYQTLSDAMHGKYLSMNSCQEKRLLALKPARP
jgi:hypothetical protein